MTRERVSISTTLPPPIGGWNARDPLDGMAETDAIKLVNVFPDTNYCKLRSGYRAHSTGLGTGLVKTLHEYTAVDGSTKLIGFANNKIYNASTYNAAATDITAGSAITDDAWSTIQYRSSGNSYMLAVNGSDQPRSYEGTTVADLTVTHASLSNDNALIQINSYLKQIYFVEKNTTRIFYLPVDTISGALSGLYDFGAVFRRGGYLLWVAPYSRDNQDGLSDMFVACSSEGEILVYTGLNPGDSSWAKIYHVKAGRPLGRRSFFYMDSELYIITIDGVWPLGALIEGGASLDRVQSVSDKIQFELNAAAINLSTTFGWEGFVYRRGHALKINVPFVASARYDQFVQNTYTKAWCRYYGIPAVTWCTFADKPYFGGVDGKIYEADVTQADAGDPISIDIKQAFSYFGDREHKKKLNMVRPILQANEDVTFFLDADVDFGAKDITSTATTSGSTGSEWDSSPWDTTAWGDDDTVQNVNWYGIRALGRCFALRVKGDLTNTTFKWHATTVLFEPGGVL